VTPHSEAIKDVELVSQFGNESPPSTISRDAVPVDPVIVIVPKDGRVLSKLSEFKLSKENVPPSYTDRSPKNDKGATSSRVAGEEPNDLKNPPGLPPDGLKARSVLEPPESVQPSKSLSNVLEIWAQDWSQSVKTTTTAMVRNIGLAKINIVCPQMCS